MSTQYTVFGNPIEHSISPQIHGRFGELTHRNIDYTRTLATKENFAESVDSFFQNGGRGCNVTVPFKVDAISLCDRLHESAALAGAANTLFRHKDGSMVGYNTDGSGLVTDLVTNKEQEITDKRILVIGAGGATRGILGPLLVKQPAQLTVANRTHEKARKLAPLFSKLGDITAIGLDDINSQGAFDLIINATAMSLNDETPSLTAEIFSDSSTAYDLMYSKDDTPFMALARELGAATVSDGFGMLVEQAADAFLVWEGVRPKTRMAYNDLKALIR